MMPVRSTPIFEQAVKAKAVHKAVSCPRRRPRVNLGISCILAGEPLGGRRALNTSSSPALFHNTPDAVSPALFSRIAPANVAGPPLRVAAGIAVGAVASMFGALYLHHHHDLSSLDNLTYALGLKPTDQEFGPADFVLNTFGPSLLHNSLTASASESSGLVQKLFASYNTWLHDSPLLCKIVTGNFFTILGDFLAQATTPGSGHGASDAPSSGADAKPQGLDLSRTLRLCIETSLVGTPIAHYWFNFLDANVMPNDPHCLQALGIKMALDQIILTPIGIAIFFAVVKLLEFKPQEIPDTIRNKWWRGLLGAYTMWPAAHAINFAFVPNEYRVLFDNCVNIFWIAFMSRTQAAQDHGANHDKAVPTAGAFSGGPGPLEHGVQGVASVESAVAPDIWVGLTAAAAAATVASGSMPQSAGSVQAFVACIAAAAAVEATSGTHGSAPALVNADSVTGLEQ